MKKSNWLKCAVLSSVAAISFTGNAMAAEIEPEMQEFVLDAMVVTASRIPTSITEAKADVSVITRKEIEEQHIEDVEEALRTVPGVQFLNYGANNVNPNLSSIRINGSKDVVILVDGVRVTDFQGAGNSGYAFLSMLNSMDNVERIEVVRGSTGAIYGSGGKGGVINIITRKVNETKSTIDVSKGSFNKESYKFNTHGRNKGLYYNAYYGKSLSGDIKDGDGNTWPASNNSKNAGVKVGYDFNDNHKVSISYNELKTRYSGIDFTHANSLFNGDYNTDDLTIKYDATINENFSNSLVYRKSSYRSYFDKADLNEPIVNDNKYTFVSDQITFVDSKNELVFGLDYSKGYNNISTKVGENADGDIIFGHHSMENYSFYLQEDWKVLPTITLSGGVRYDRPKKSSHDYDFDSNTAVSYKMSWDISDKDVLYAGRSDFYIMPSMIQMYDEEYGNDSLKPAKGRTTSIGYNRTFDENNIFTLNWFKTESETYIGLDKDGKYQSFDGGLDRGWNAQFMTQIDENWSANIGWAHLFHDVAGDANYSMGYYPKDMATFAINYEKEKFGASFSGFYFMRKVNPDYDSKAGWPADNYGVYNLSLNYTPEKNMTFYAKIENIFDKLWAEHTNGIHDGGKPGQWYSMPGRSFVLGMQVKF